MNSVTDDNGPQVIAADVGKDVMVELRFPGVSGYKWDVVFDGSQVSLRRSETKPAMRRMGAKAKQVFHFEPLKRGDHQLKFLLKRPWEDGPIETKDFILHVEGTEE